jgi:hypothetical protein
MARPRKNIKKVPFNMTIERSLRERAARLAFTRNESLSELIAKLLERELGSPSGTLTGADCICGDSARTQGNQEVGLRPQGLSPAVKALVEAGKAVRAPRAPTRAPRR